MMLRSISEKGPPRAATLALRWTGLAVMAGLLLAALGPFGSYMNGGAVQRACYWIGAMLLGLVLYGAAFRATNRLAPAGSRLQWPVLIAMTLLASVPEALATRAAAFRIWPELARLSLSLPLWFAQTATIGLIAMVGTTIAFRRSATAPTAPEEGTVSFQPLSDGTTLLPDDLLALQMEDHYVRVHRPTGSELILMPLSRAIGIVRVEGLRTHRSWWVARHAVASVEGTPRSMRLHLSNGIVAPIARSAVIQLKAAGWIAAHEGSVSFRVETQTSKNG